MHTMHQLPHDIASHVYHSKTRTSTSRTPTEKNIQIQPPVSYYCTSTEAQTEKPKQN